MFLWALLKTSESELARRLFGLIFWFEKNQNTGKPRNTTVFLCFSVLFPLEKPQAFSNSRFRSALVRGI